MLDIGLGARAVLSVPGTGTVLWARRDAAWLRLPGGVAGLAAPSAPAGPLWARGAAPGEPFAGGMEVEVLAGGDLVAGRFRLPLGTVARWEGGLPASFDERAVAAVHAALARARPSALVGDTRFALATRSVTHGDLRGAAAVLGGYGPGLTPAGDDVLAGIILAARVRRGPAASEGLLAVAASVETTELSAAFLHWAARGQHVAPVHELLLAAAAGDKAEARRAAGRLEAFGASSGADVALGLRVGLAAPVSVAV